MSRPPDTKVRVGAGRRSTRANAISLSGGRMAAALGQWLALIVLAKLSDVESVGLYALAQALCIPVAEIARLGLRELRASDVRDDFASPVYLAMRSGAAAAAFVVMVVLGLLFTDSRQAFWVVVLYAATRIVELMSDIFYAILQREERLDLVARSLGLLAGASLVGLTAGFVLTATVAGAVAGQVVAYVAVFVGFDVRVTRGYMADHPHGLLRPVWDAGELARLARRVAPLAIGTVLAMVSLHATRLFVAGELGVEALGLFVPVMVLAMAPGRVFQALGTAATTRLSVLHASGRRGDFVGLMWTLLAVTAGASLVGIVVAAVLGEWLLGVIYTDAYAGEGTLLVLVVVAAALRFSAEMLQQAVVAAQRFWWLTSNYAANAVVALVASAVLVPRHGLDGAGAALVVGASFQLVVLAVAALRSLPTEPTDLGVTS